MVNKKFALIGLMIIFIFTSCVLNRDKNYIATEYESNVQDIGKCKIVERTYTDDDVSVEKQIRITYPEIEAVENVETIQKLNQDIKGLALGVLTEFSSLNEMNIDVKYLPVACTDELFSVCFIVKTFHKAQAYPLIRIKTLNVDATTGEKLKLKDIIDIDNLTSDNFFHYFDNITPYEEDVIMVRKQVDEYVEDYLNRLFEIVQTCDDDDNVECHSYLTKDSVIISISVPHAIGSYALYEASYDSLRDVMNMDNPIWSEVLDVK